MAEETANAGESSMKQLVIPLVVLTVAAGAGGGALGWRLGAAAPVESGAASSKEPAHDSPGHGGGEKAKEAPDPKADLVVKDLAPILTNISGSNVNWARLQASVLFDAKGLPHPEHMLAELAGDIVAYLRTVPMSALEGADGLRRLNEDLDERASVRSEGRVRKVIIQSLVLQ